MHRFPETGIPAPEGCAEPVASDSRRVWCRPHTARAAGSAPLPMLTARDLARLTGWSHRTAKRWLATWWERQETDPTVPRVTRASTGGRPGYRVERAGVARWALSAVT